LITLIPKEEEAKTLKKFRPISLINCDRLLANNQTAFDKGRFILESVVSAHEILHDAAQKGKEGLVLKLDYEKTYDQVDWSFLEEMMMTR
jgi:SAM-dependent MidA family methyltransferase